MRYLLLIILVANANAGDAPPIATATSPVRVHVDQVGWRTTAHKLAIVASDAPLPADLRLSLARADTSTPVTVATTLTPFAGGAKDEESGDHVAHLDFSALTEPGRYVVLIEHGDRRERSYAFTIADQPWRDVAAAMWKGFYFQRADCAKDERWAGPWQHGLAHRGPGQSTEARVYRWNGARHFEAVGTEIDDPTPRDVSGGWWDAGDFSKYLGNTVVCIDDLLLAVRLAGDAYADDQFAIPESGNTIPDAFDEIRYGVEFVLKMAEPGGAAFGKAYEKGACPPDADTSPVQLTQTTSGATMNRCAALAYAALVWRERGLDAKFQARCRDEALEAWKLLATRPHPWPADPNDPSKQAYTGEWFAADFAKSRALAAVSLWQLTKEATFHATAREIMRGWTAIPPGEEIELFPVIHAYAHAVGADPAEVARLKALVFASADAVVAQCGSARPYAAGVRGYWWGSNRFVAQHGTVCVLAAELSDDAAKKAAWLAAAEEYVHYLFGRNAIGQCFVSNLTALGVENSAMVMFHTWVGHDNADAYGQQFIGSGPGKVGPFPGLVVGGVNGGMKRYTTDLHWQQSPWEFNEPDITYQSPAVLLVGYLGLRGR